MPQMLILSSAEEMDPLFRRAFGDEFFLVFLRDAGKAPALLEETAFDAITAVGDAAAALPALRPFATVLIAVGAPEEAAMPGIYRVPPDERSLKLAAAWIGATREIFAGLNEENHALQKKLEDLRLQGRAKAILCKTLGFSEEQAHRYLEKQAMSLRISKNEAARRILSTYEN